MIHRSGWLLVIVVAICPIAGTAQEAPSKGKAAPAFTPRTAAQVDLTGFWVSIVTEDWMYRMVTPPKGDSGSVPLNQNGVRVANEWDPARDTAEHEPCRAYGAAGLMRRPGRLHIYWEDDRTLRIDFDAGTQTRLLHFAEFLPPEGFGTSSIEGMHVLASAFVVGSVAVIDLRLLGVKAFNDSIQRLMKQVLPLTWTAFACAVLTGATLFSSGAVEYSRNIAFRLKFLMLMLAAVNMLVFHLLICRGLTDWDDAIKTPAVVRCAGVTSLLLWIAVVGCGRWIGFTDVP